MLIDTQDFLKVCLFIDSIGWSISNPSITYRLIIDYSQLSVISIKYVWIIQQGILFKNWFIAQQRWGLIRQLRSVANQMAWIETKSDSIPCIIPSIQPYSTQGIKHSHPFFIKFFWVFWLHKFWISNSYLSF